MPAILVALIFRTLDALRVFDLPYVLTNGANGTTTLSLLAQQTFAENRIYGLGSALVDPDVHHRDDRVVHLHPDSWAATSAAWRRSDMEAASAPQRARRARRRRRKKASAPSRSTPWWLWIAVAAIVVFCLFPFYWLINMSLKTGPDLSSSDLFPPNPTLDNYTVDLPERRLHARAGATARSWALVDDVPGDHRRLVLRVRARAAALQGQVPILLALVLSITTFPAIAIAAPLFRLWSDIGLFNTLIGLIIPYLTFALPLAIYILVSFFKEIPKDLEEAALVDGATHFQAFRKVVVPLAAPGLATAAILAFIAAWNEFLFAITLTSSPKARTVPAAIAFFTGSTQFEVPLGTHRAASVVISIPLILLVLLFQKRIVAGLTAGAVKG